MSDERFKVNDEELDNVTGGVTASKNTSLGSVDKKLGRKVEEKTEGALLREQKNKQARSGKK